MTARRTVGTALGVIFLVEWGDLTQILTASLAARDHDPLSVGTGALPALWRLPGSRSSPDANWPESRLGSCGV